MPEVPTPAKPQQWWAWLLLGILVIVIVIVVSNVVSHNRTPDTGTSGTSSEKPSCSEEWDSHITDIEWQHTYATDTRDHWVAWCKAERVQFANAPEMAP